MGKCPAQVMPAIVSPDEAYFLSVDWCASLIRSGQYISAVPYSRRCKTDTTEDAFFGRTLNDQTTIPACLLLYPIPTPPTTSYRPQSLPVLSSSSSPSQPSPSSSPSSPSSSLPPQLQVPSAPTHKSANAASRFHLHFPSPSILVLVALEHGVNAYPHISHGGLVATLLDEAMGMLLTLNGALDEDKRLGGGDDDDDDDDDDDNHDDNGHECTLCQNKRGTNVDESRNHDAREMNKRSSSSSSSSSNSVIHTPKLDRNPPTAHEPSQRCARQSSQGKEPDSTLPASRAGLRLSSRPAISYVTKEMRVRYRRPVRTPAVFLITVTTLNGNDETPDTRSVKDQPDGKIGTNEGKLHPHGSPTTGASCSLASTTAPAAVTVSSPARPRQAKAPSKQLDDGHRDLVLRATLMDRSDGQILAVGDAVFAMPKSKQASRPATSHRPRL